MAPSPGKVSKEEMLLWERMRCVAWGITQYELHAESGKFVFPAANSVFGCVDDGAGAGGGPRGGGGSTTGSLFPYELKSSCGGARLNAVPCPSNPDLVAYVGSGDIWVTNVVTGQEERLTFSQKGLRAGNASAPGCDAGLSDDPVTSGLPSYVMQEEFNRYRGLFWRPRHDGRTYTILYEEVDESMVDLLKFASPYSPSEVEEFRFPRAGAANAKSEVRTVSFETDGDDVITVIREGELRSPLENYFPDTEYVVRLGWTPDGDK